MTAEVKDIDGCMLCGLKTGSQKVSDGSNAFCCHGCHAVYGILSAKGALDNYQDSPIFQQAVSSGLISNPSLLENFKKTESVEHTDEIKKYYFELSDMWCPSCAEVIRLILLQEKGVNHCIIDYCTDLACVEYSPRYLAKEDIDRLIIKLGYGVQPLQGEGSRPVSFSLLLRFILAAFCSLNIMMFSYPLYANYFSKDATGYSELLARLSFFASLPVVTVCIWPIVRRFFNSLFVGIIGMEALVLTGVFSAFGLSVYELLQGGTHVYFDSMSVIVTLVLLGKIIESKAKFSSKDTLIRLVRSTPKRARKCFDNGEERFVTMKEIAPGDIVKAVTGEKIVLDGVVVSGEAACDESIMTGESLPRRKKADDPVLGGTLVQRGNLCYRVSTDIQETALQKIIDSINLDIGHKSVYIRAADKVVKYIAPTVIIIALVTGIFTYLIAGDNATHAALIRMASILLISCPCAIGIAAPLAESTMMHTLANHGALVRNRACLPLLGRESCFVCDKTGTITKGCFYVKSGLEQLNAQQLSVLKSLTSQSTHPVAISTFHAIDDIRALPQMITEEVAGMGMIGRHEGTTYLFGSSALLNSKGLKVPETAKNSQVDTVSYFCEGSGPITPIVLGDELREDAVDTVSSFYPTPTYLLSGDSESVVKTIAKKCHFTGYRSECHPLEKREFITDLTTQGKTVCMLGDGINDAPALTAASVGMSVVNATDVSIHVSDIVLTTDKLTTIKKICQIGRKGQRIVKQNLFWAFFYNSIGIILAIFGYLTPIYAAFAMVTSSLFVIYNAKRVQNN